MKENAASRASAIALARRPQRDGARRARGAVQFAGERKDASAIHMRLDEIGDSVETPVERLRLARLHQSKMAFGQRDVIPARQRADDRNAQGLDRLDREPPVALAPDAIDDGACDPQPRVKCRAALHDRRRGLRLPGDIEDEEDRHVERRRDICRSAAAPGRRRHAVEQPHRGFAQRQRAPGVAWLASALRSSGAMAQELRLTPSAPDAAAWKAGSM